MVLVTELPTRTQTGCCHLASPAPCVSGGALQQSWRPPIPCVSLQDLPGCAVSPGGGVGHCHCWGLESIACPALLPFSLLYLTVLIFGVFGVSRHWFYVDVAPKHGSSLENIYYFKVPTVFF